MAPTASSRRSLLERLFAMDRQEHSFIVRVLLGVLLPSILFLLGPLLGAPGSALMWFVSSTTVFVAGWLGGFVSGAVATLLSAAIVHHWLLPAHDDRGWLGSSEMAQFLAFAAAGLLVSLLHGQLRRTVRKLDQRRREASAQAEQLEQTRAQLEDAQARLELALDSAHIGVWTRDLRTGRVEWDARVRTMLGVPHDVVDTGSYAEYWRDHLLPGEAERLDEAHRNVGSTPQHEMVRLRLDDGRLRTIHTTALLRHRDGKPVELVGTNRDITTDLEVEQQLRLALSRLELARKATDVGFWRWETTTGRVDWDRCVHDWFELQHVPHGGITYVQWLSRVHPEDVERVLDTVRRAREDGKAHLVVYRLVLPSGVERHVKSSGILERDANGHELGLIGIHQDVTTDIVTSRALQAREREVHALNRQLEDRVSERTAALLDALLHAEAATHAKAAFLRNISHELRTPLNPILGFTHLLAQSITDQEQRLHLQHIEAGGRRLLGLVTNLIELTRSSADESAHTAFDVAATVDAVIDTYRVTAADKGLPVEAQVDPSIPKGLTGDAIRVASVLEQLLSNAIKFSERGRIQLRSTLGRSGPGFVIVRFEVQDEGIGIAADMQPHVFDAFRQVRDTTIARADGLGIGLALAKRAVDRLGGEIGVQSEPGAGSTFWFTARFMHEPKAVSPAAADDRLYG